MNVQQKHIESQKRIGTLGNSPVIEVRTFGGLHLVVAKKDGEMVTLGTGPHRAVARYIARKREPSIMITELSKSDHVDEASIISVLPKYEAMTDALNKAIKE